MVSVDISASNPALAAFAFYAAILAFKMMFMSVLTAKQRFAKGVFANAEDLQGSKTKVKYDDPDVERVRRAHLNDMENIPLFFILAPLYVLTNPALTTAVWAFRIFTGARVLHTFVYAVMPMPQPSRALAWGAGVLVNLYMAVTIICHFCH